MCDKLVRNVCGVGLNEYLIFSFLGLELGRAPCEIWPFLRPFFKTNFLFKISPILLILASLKLDPKKPEFNASWPQLRTFVTLCNAQAQSSRSAKEPKQQKFIPQLSRSLNIRRDKSSLASKFFTISWSWRNYFQFCFVFSFCINHLRVRRVQKP